MNRFHNNSEAGVATIEFAVTASFFIVILLAVFSAGYMFWLHNALVEATRRGARYAANECRPGAVDCPGSDTSLERIRNVTLYGSSTPTTTPLIHDLTSTNVTVEYSDNTAPTGQPPNDFGVARGTVSVRITGYDFKFILAPVSVQMPQYQTTLTGESAGLIPTGTCP